MLKINSKTTGDKDAGTNTEFSLTNLTENLFCAKNQSKQRYKEIRDKNRTKKKRKKKGAKINCSKSTVYLTIIRCQWLEQSKCSKNPLCLSKK